MILSKILSRIAIISMILILFMNPATAYQTNVNVNAPEKADNDFSVIIEIENVTDLDSGQFDLHFDPALVRVTGIDDGTIAKTTIPIADWASVSKNTIRVLFNLPDIDGVSGTGTLATIHFETIVPGDCVIDVSDGLLVNTMAQVIPANWNGVRSVVPNIPVSTDEAEHKTPGPGPLFLISAIAAAFLVSRKKE
ncbi:MAG TPA: hypothetical protein C5S50_03725 [Methanosarcinaceae archaeon]|nr:hypothetical protein [Methanosarcinaceae archaeon]HJH31295.1 hypothetical protein [Methanosarcinaceae archaeon]